MITTTTTGNGTNHGVAPQGRRPAPGERERILAEWASSGRSLEEMAAMTGWSRHSLYRWQRQAAKGRSPTARLAPAKLVAVPRPAAVTGPWAAEIGLGRAVVRVAAGCPAKWIAEVVEALKPC